MVRERKGFVEERSGRLWARPILADGSLGKRSPLPPGTSLARAQATAAAMTERMQRDGATKESLIAARRAAQRAEAPRSPTVSAWFETWLNEREARGLTSVRTDRGRWSKWIEPQLGALEMVAVTTEDLERFVQHLDEESRGDKLHWKTARNVWGLVSKAFDDAARSKTLQIRVRKDNPAKGVRPPDEGEARGKQFLYPSEFLAVLNHKDIPQRWARLIAVQTYLYCRAGELEALHVEDVDLEHRTVHIHRSIDRDKDELKEVKTNSPRRIPIEPNLLPLLFELVMDARAEGRERLVEMPPLHYLAARLRKYLQWASVARKELYRTTRTSKQITWHDLRATAATWLAIRGEAPQSVMAKCGHENMETTLGYVRLAAVLSEQPSSVFPAIPEAILVSQSASQDPKATGSKGGKLAQLLKKAKRPQRDSNPLKRTHSTGIQPVSDTYSAEHCDDNAQLSVGNVVIGKRLGNEEPVSSQNPIAGLPPYRPEASSPTLPTHPDAAARLAESGRCVAVESQVWDALDATALHLADPAAGGGR